MATKELLENYKKRMESLKRIEDEEYKVLKMLFIPYEDDIVKAYINGEYSFEILNNKTLYETIKNMNSVVKENVYNRLFNDLSIVYNWMWTDEDNNISIEFGSDKKNKK